MDAAELMFSGITRQAEMVRAGEVSSRELVQACLDRIEELDPRLNAWRVVLAERALAEADQADARRGAGDDRPLLGVPLAVKDDVRMLGTSTAWGTSAHAGEVTEDEAVLVQRLRAAGAILVGKTNVPEMTIWPFTESPTFGPTRNPWDPSRTPGGSSGGTGAAVASGMVGAGTGSDGGGSIRIPAGWCGLFGLKPTRDLVPIAPHVDAWEGLSVNGALTRSVADCALFLDSVTEPAPAGAFAAAVRAPERPLRVVWTTKRLPGASPFPRLDPEHRAAVERTAELLASLGHHVEQRDPDYGARAFPNFLARYLRGIKGDIDEMAHPERLEPRTLAMRRLGALWHPAVVARMRRGEAALRARIWAGVGEADVILTPQASNPPPEVGRWEGRGAVATLNGVAGYVPYNAIFNATGEPAAAVPAGISSRGLPLSVQVVARQGADRLLLSLAAQLESERPWAEHRPPVS